MSADEMCADKTPLGGLVIDAMRGLWVERGFPFWRRRVGHGGEFELSPREVGCGERLLIYVHGYNEVPEVAVGYGERNIAAGWREAGEDGAVGTFLWASRFGVLGFRRSVQAADATAPAFAGAVAAIHAACPAMRVHVLAHSLGARVVLRALQLGAGPICDVALVAPAIRDDALEPGGEFGEVLGRVGRILFTQNAADRSLRWYRLQGRRALGLRGFRYPDRIPSNVFAEDMREAWSGHGRDGGHGAILHPGFWGAFWERVRARGFLG